MKCSATPLHSGSPAYVGVDRMPSPFGSRPGTALPCYCEPQSCRRPRPREIGLPKPPIWAQTPWRTGSTAPPSGRPSSRHAIRRPTPLFHGQSFPYLGCTRSILGSSLFHGHTRTAAELGRGRDPRHQVIRLGVGHTHHRGLRRLVRVGALDGEPENDKVGRMSNAEADHLPRTLPVAWLAPRVTKPRPGSAFSSSEGSHTRRRWKTIQWDRATLVRSLNTRLVTRAAVAGEDESGPYRDGVHSSPRGRFWGTVTPLVHRDRPTKPDQRTRVKSPPNARNSERHAENSERTLSERGRAITRSPGEEEWTKRCPTERTKQRATRGEQRAHTRNTASAHSQNADVRSRGPRGRSMDDWRRKQHSHLTPQNAHDSERTLRNAARR